MLPDHLGAAYRELPHLHWGIHMARLNVRCCCQPTKILGTLEVPDAIAHHGGRFQVIVSNVDVLLHRNDRECLLDELPALGLETVEVRKIGLPCTVSELERRLARYPLPAEPMPSEYAVYSEERPIEFWRKVRGFREAT